MLLHEQPGRLRHCDLGFLLRNPWITAARDLAQKLQGLLAGRFRRPRGTMHPDGEPAQPARDPLLEEVNRRTLTATSAETAQFRVTNKLALAQPLHRRLGDLRVHDVGHRLLPRSGPRPPEWWPLANNWQTCCGILVASSWRMLSD